MKEITKIETEYGTMYVCDNCGSHSESEHDIIHHNTCRMHDSLYWQVVEATKADLGRDEIENMVKSAAKEIYFWVQDAVGDMAHDRSFLDDEWQEKIKRAKNRGVSDIEGWLADAFFDDVDTLRDLMGDRIYDKATEIVGSKDVIVHSIVMVLICKTIKKHGHTSMGIAMDIIITQHDALIEKLAERNREKVKQCVKNLLKTV